LLVVPKSPKKAGKILKTIKKEKTSPGRKRTSTDNQGEESSAKVTKLSNVVPITMTATVSLEQPLSDLPVC
jgi:hypothetical protein